MIIAYVLCDRCGHVALEHCLVHDHIEHKNRELCQSCEEVFMRQLDAIPWGTVENGNKIPQDRAQFDMITHIFSSRLHGSEFI